jgi:FkbM family methyltransferase
MNPWKPWFIFRPLQVLRRLTYSPTSTHRHLPVAWGGHLLALDDDHIGRCLGTTGIYDLAVSELLFRLIHPGDLVVDAGANIGYMSVLAATAGAHVIAFEPNPALLPTLRQNLGTRGDVRPVALGAERKHAVLIPADPAAHNSGLGRLGTSTEKGAVPVEVETLDDELHGRSVAILKLDVEGAEQAVLEGAASALKDGRLRHIIFEDHHGANSAVMTQLLGHGYTIYSIEWTLSGPKLGDPGRVSAHARYEAPSYLATLAPGVARAACAGRGWMALRSASATGTRRRVRTSR